MDQIWTEELGEGPLIAIALHDGHSVRNEVRPFLTVSGEDRLREEDPFTAQWTRMAPCAVVATRSRFEVDLNRSPKAAIYRSPDDAWGSGCGSRTFRTRCSHTPWQLTLTFTGEWKS